MPDGDIMTMIVSDKTGTLITSNHTGIVDDTNFLLFIKVRTPNHRPLSPAAHASAHAHAATHAPKIPHGPCGAETVRRAPWR